MDAILFGSNPRVGDIADAIKHLADHKELYWTVGFKIAKKYFSFPLLGFIHVAGKQVEYKATINQILPFEPAHYENAAVKPESWRQEWKDVKRRPHLPQENTFIITQIERVSCEATSFKKPGGGSVTHAPQSYVRVLPP